MKEKRFYHTALEDSLLSGTRLKERIDAAIARESTVPKGQPANFLRRHTVGTRIVVPAAAVLLLLTLSVGLLVIVHGRSGDHAAARPDQTGLQETPTPGVTLEPDPTLLPGALTVPSPTPVSPTEWPYPSDEDRFVPEVTPAPTPIPDALYSAAPTIQPTPTP